MKKLLFRKFIWLIIYTLIYIYFMIFNWKVFTISLEISLGPGSLKIPPFLILFLIGFIFIGILSWSNYISNLQKIIYELEQGVKLGEMREKLIRNKFHEELLNANNIEALREKLGIEEMRQTQASLGKRLLEMQETGKPNMQDQ